MRLFRDRGMSGYTSKGLIEECISEELLPLTNKSISIKWFKGYIKH